MEPVKLNLRTIGLEVFSLPLSEADLAAIETQTAGTPASSASTHKANAE